MYLYEYIWVLTIILKTLNTANKRQYYYPGACSRLFSVPNHLRKRATLQRRYTYTHTYISAVPYYYYSLYCYYYHYYWGEGVCFLFHLTLTRSQLFIIDVPAAALVHYNIVKHNIILCI